MEREPYIIRIEYKRHSPGWRVRITKDGVLYKADFKDHNYGSQEKSLVAAKRWRQKTLRELGLSLRDFPKRYFKKPNSRNKSGRVGVFFKLDNSKKGYEYPMWVVSWAPEVGVNKIRRFYWHHYPSPEAAKAAAIRFREKKEREIDAQS